MPDPFSTATTALQLADIAFRVFSSLAKFANSAKSADTAARALQDKVRALWTTVSCVNSVICVRDESAEEQPLSGEELRLREKLNKDISACYRLLTEFDASLDGLFRNESNPNWLGKSLLQLQLNKRDGAIKRLENVLETRLQMLQVSLACLEVLTSVNNHQQVIRFLNNLTSEIAKSQDNWKEFRKVRTQLPKLNAGDIQQEEGPMQAADLARLEKMIDEDQQSIEGEYQGLIAEATAIQRSTTSSVGSRTDSGEVPSSAHSEVNREPERSLSSPSIETEDDRLFDPTPEFDDTTHSEPLEILIDRFNQKALDDQKIAHYKQAETHLREAIALLQERHVGYGKSFGNYAEMQSLLAEILTDQKRYDESDAIRHALLQGKTTFIPTKSARKNAAAKGDLSHERALSSATQYHKLAEGYRKRYLDHPAQGAQSDQLLVNAELFAKRAFKCRRNFLTASDHDFIETVELLVSIYRDQVKPVYADAYAQQYLPGSAALSQPSLGCMSRRSSSSLDSIAPRISLQPIFTAEGSEGSTAQRDDSVINSPNTLRKTDTGLTEVQDPRQTTNSASPRTSILQAVQKDDDKATLMLLDQAGPRSKMVNIALFEAARVGSQKMTSLLLGHDAQANAMNEAMQSPLHIAAECGHLAVVQQLLDAHADPDLHGADGWTAVHFAVHKDRRHVLNTLLNHTHHADVNVKNAYGNTGLHVAAEQGNFELADDLLRACADHRIENSGGLTALEVAVDCHQREFVRSWIASDLPCDVHWDKMTQVSLHIKAMVDRHLVTKADTMEKSAGTADLVEESDDSLPASAQAKSLRSRAGSIGSRSSITSVVRHLKDVVPRKLASARS